MLFRDYTWWIWLATAAALIVGLCFHSAGLVAAVVISAAQAVFFSYREKSLSAFPAQLRIAYLALLVVLYFPPLRVGYWVPAIGTLALCLFGYCFMARCLSLLPLNRTSGLTPGLVARTFTTPPRLDRAAEAEGASGCPGGVCTLEVQLGELRAL